MQILSVALLRLRTDVGRRSQRRRDQKAHAYGPKRMRARRSNSVKKAECLLWFAEPGGLQAQRWHSTKQREQNATGTEAPANGLFSHDSFRPRLL